MSTTTARRSSFKVIEGGRTSPRPRDIVGHIIIQSGHDTRTSLTRRYTELDSAIPRLTAWMMKDGRAGEVCEVYHAITGMQLGTIKMTAKGRLVTEWVWD